MPLIWKEILTICLFIIPAHSLLTDKSKIRANLNFTELVTYDGYRHETHKVVTEDGYKLTVFRIPPKSECDKKLPLLFQHGLYLSGDDCIVPGPGVAHCYIYSDNCYDVWIGNSRGTRYSRDHVSLDPDTDHEFWDFSFPKLGIYDNAAVIDYILRNTEQEQLYYVGHSAGVASLIVLGSKKPEYNSKVKTAFGLSATTWIGNAKLPLVTVQKLVSNFNVSGDEILEHGGVVQIAAESLCGLKLSYYKCSTILFSILGYDGFQIAKDVFPVVVGHAPAGVSWKHFVHWGQIAKDGFKEYDYKDDNVKIYGQSTPPEFELENVKMKFVLLASENDWLADLKDVQKLHSKLPNSELCVLKDKLFSHLAFVYGKGIPVSITPSIINYIENNELDC